MLVSEHAAPDADEKTLLDRGEGAGYARGDGCGAALPLTAGKAREDDIMAAKILEDVRVDVAISTSSTSVSGRESSQAQPAVNGNRPSGAPLEKIPMELRR